MNNVIGLRCINWEKNLEQSRDYIHVLIAALKTEYWMLSMIMEKSKEPCLRNVLYTQKIILFSLSALSSGGALNTTSSVTGRVIPLYRTVNLGEQLA